MSSFNFCCNALKLLFCYLKTENLGNNVLKKYKALFFGKNYFPTLMIFTKTNNNKSFITIKILKTSMLLLMLVVLDSLGISVLFSKKSTHILINFFWWRVTVKSYLWQFGILVLSTKRTQCCLRLPKYLFLKPPESKADFIYPQKVHDKIQ